MLNLEGYVGYAKDFVGKTIAYAELYQGEIVMRFTDGTYTGIEAQLGCCGDDPELGFMRPSSFQLYVAGVISGEVLKQEEERINEMKKKLRRARWEELNKEFGNQNQEGDKK